VTARRPVLESAFHIEIDRIACDAYGTCAELLPDMIDLDEWGYPIIAAGHVPVHLLDHARRAVDSCPVLALRLAAVDRAKIFPTSGTGWSARPEVRPEPRPDPRPDRLEGTPPWPPRPAARPDRRRPLPRKGG
jgi:ferredoxin